MEKDYIYIKNNLYKHAQVIFAIVGLAIASLAFYANKVIESQAGNNILWYSIFLLHMAAGMLYGKHITVLYENSNLDHLTKIKNARSFKNQLTQDISKYKKDSRGLSLLAADIDNFKSINDQYGHPTGDEVIKRVAEILEQGVRNTDTVARVGGEEFSIILPDTNLDGAYVLAERIRNKVADERFSFNNITFGITISIGISCMSDDCEKEKLLRTADIALYKAKETKNTSCRYLQ